MTTPQKTDWEEWIVFMVERSKVKPFTMKEARILVSHLRSTQHQEDMAKVREMVVRERKHWIEAMETTNYPENNELIYAAKADAVDDLLSQLEEE